MKRFIDIARTDIAIAWWKAAASILEASGGDEQVANRACFEVRNNGMTINEADHVAYLITTLAEEARRG